MIINKNALNNIIFSHGNSSNLATIYPFLIDLSTQFKVNYIIDIFVSKNVNYRLNKNEIFIKKYIFIVKKFF
jgi:hypothetical protein